MQKWGIQGAYSCFSRYGQGNMETEDRYLRRTDSKAKSTAGIFAKSVKIELIKRRKEWSRERGQII